MESSQEETENLAPWLRILDEAEKRHETQLNALLNEYEGNGDSENVTRVKAENAFEHITVSTISIQKSIADSCLYKKSLFYLKNIISTFFLMISTPPPPG